MEKKDLLKDTIKHIDIKSYDSTQLIDAMRDMSFTSRDTARATDILMMMVGEKECTNILTIAGSTSAAGCMQVYVDMVRNKMVDVVVSTGASIIDMDLFEALGYKHYKGKNTRKRAKCRLCFCIAVVRRVLLMCLNICRSILR